MKRIILYGIILIGVFLIPVKPIDISDLEPIEVVYLSKKEEKVTLQTDTKDIGSGQSVQEALEDMKNKSSGIVYLDTAEYLLVSEDSVDQIPDMKPYLHHSVRVGIWEGEGDISEASRYMRAHKIGCKIKNWSPSVKLPKLPREMSEK